MFQKVRGTINTAKAMSTCAKCPQYKEMNVNDREAFIQVSTVLPGTKPPQPDSALAEDQA
jgi:hypothetical protein